MVFALLDAATTWYALTALHLNEANPIAHWAITRFGLSWALGLRVLVGAVVLGLITLGSVAPIPRHRVMTNRSCAALLTGVVVLWGVVALLNVAKIAAVALG